MEPTFRLDRIEFREDAPTEVTFAFRSDTAIGSFIIDVPAETLPGVVPLTAAQALTVQLEHVRDALARSVRNTI